MKHLSYLSIGILFGIVMTKSEAISWFRIQEMFLFHSFHMYGIIGVAVGLGLAQVALIKRLQLKDKNDNLIAFTAKQKGIVRYLVGGIIFGLGWAMTGACPGPMYTLLGHGFAALGIVILSALFGTFVYGILRPKLPH